MPTSTSKTTTSTHASPAADLAQQLAHSQSTIVYVDADLDNVSDADLLAADPPLHVERDLVRGLWAVRLATEDEVLAAQTLPVAPATSTSSST